MEKARRNRLERKRDLQMDITLVVMLVLMLLLFLSLFGIGGGVGKILSEIMFGLFGIGAYCIPAYLFVFCVLLLSEKYDSRTGIRMFSILFLIVNVQTAGHLWLQHYHLVALDLPFDPAAAFRISASCRSGGGVIGGALAWLLYYAFRMTMSVVILAGFFVIALLLLFQRSPAGAVRRWLAGGGEDDAPGFSQRRAMRRRERLERLEQERERQIEKEASRILELEEARLERKARMLKEAQYGAADGTRRKRRRNVLDLEHTQLKKKGSRSGDGKRGSNGRGRNDAAAVKRRDIHEITVFDEEERDVLTLPARERRSFSADEENRSPASARYRNAGMPDPEGTKYRRSEYLYAITDPAGRENTALPSSEEFIPSSPADGRESFAPGSSESPDLSSPAAFRRTDAPGLPFDTGTSSQGDGRAAAAVAFDRKNAPVSVDRDGSAGPLPPTEEALSGISVHRENAKASKAPAGRIAAPKKGSTYSSPPFSLLKKAEGGKNEETERELKETAYRLQETLRTFGVQVTITDISQGPSVTRYELKPDQGVKVSRIVSLSDDIKLRLAATDIRIEAPIPGKSAIGIEVPNKHETTVHLRELLESREFRRYDGKLPIAVGKDIGGKIIVADIARMPHVLIAGATGSGKSVCINTIILSILYRTPPEKVRLLMIDPKVVELSVYKRIPHLIIPVVTDAKKASAALNWAVAEMEKRYRLFAAAGVRDLNGFNALASSYQNEDGGPQYGPLPRLVIIVDELSDLMMVAKSEVESAIVRLAQLARAAGIHLIIATQRPSVDVITGLIKANMPSRIAFAVTSQVDSRTILDMAGAEKLIGKGDMLFYPQNYQKPARIQGAFVSDEEVTQVVKYIKANNRDAGHDEDVAREIENIAVNGVPASGSTPDLKNVPGRDEYFEEAGRYIIEKNKASIGHLQRVFKIGFNRAARIMDQLAEAGVVSEESSTRARQVLMSMPEFENYLENG